MKYVLLLLIILAGSPTFTDRRLCPVTNLITNGDFDTDLSGWNTTDFAYRYDVYHGAPGSAYADLQAKIAVTMSQQPTTGGNSGTMYLHRFSMYVKPELSPIKDFVLNVFEPLGATFFQESIDIPLSDEWILIEREFAIEGDTTIQVSFSIPGVTDPSGDYKYQGNPLLDDISLEDITSETEAATNSCGELVWELQKRRTDWQAVKMEQGRYPEALNRAISLAPRPLWPQVVDTSLATVEEQRRYSLAALTDIVDTQQVRSVYIEGSDDHYYEIERWQVEDNAGALTLVLDNDPADEGLTIKLVYITEPTQVDCTDQNLTIDIDREWVLAQAMTLLLLEADSQLTGEDPARIERQLVYWDQARAGRERTERRRPTGRVRSFKWDVIR